MQAQKARTLEIKNYQTKLHKRLTLSDIRKLKIPADRFSKISGGFHFNLLISQSKKFNLLINLESSMSTS